MRYFILLLTLSIALLASGTVKLGNLEWQDNSQAKTTNLNWSEAKEYCQNLSLSGHDDWRLPSIKELQSIADVSRYNPAIKRGFTNVNTSSDYWSSSEGVSDAKYAWIVSFKYGNTNGYTKSYEYCVRCVRARQ